MTRSLVNGAGNEHLDDEDLLRREKSEEREYHRLWDRERRHSKTTYRVHAVSRLLELAWERWARTLQAVRHRGLTPARRPRDKTS